MGLTYATVGRMDAGRVKAFHVFVSTRAFQREKGIFIIAKHILILHVILSMRSNQGGMLGRNEHTW
jgi:hypothetical protein